MSRFLSVVILAAGRSRRMQSRIPKPLHKIGGREMLGHVLATAQSLEPDRIIVVTDSETGPVAAFARQAVAGTRIAVQPCPTGTASAVLAAAPELAGDDGESIVLYGDSPLVRADTLRSMRRLRSDTGAAAVLMAFEATDPTGYGRVLLDQADIVKRIVEEREATDDGRAQRLCNAGPLAADTRLLLSAARAIDADRDGAERYLTALPVKFRQAGHAVRVLVGSPDEAVGANSRSELAAAEAAFQRRAREAAMSGGATLQHPESAWLAFDSCIEADATLGPNVVLGPGVRICGGAVILPFSSLEGCVIGPDARIGPHARIRPGSVIGTGARIGNYVEIKNASIGDGAKVSHLAYVGDADVGTGANVGAGAITCNYDGVRKHRTRIGAGAFIGSNCCLVAPVSVGDNAYVGSGAVITRDVEANALALARAPQENRPGRAARLRARRSRED